MGTDNDWDNNIVSGGQIVHTGGGFSGSGTAQYKYGAEVARTTFRVALDAALYPEKSNDWSPYLSSYNWRLDSGFQQQNGSSFSSTTFLSCRGPNTNQNINMFDDWRNNAFISGPTYSTLIAASSDITNAEAMIDAAGTYSISRRVTRKSVSSFVGYDYQPDAEWSNGECR